MDMMHNGPTCDYELKYSDLDPIHHELNDGASVWNVDNDEAEIIDRELLKENGDSLDILLIFVSSVYSFVESSLKHCKGCSFLGLKQ